MTQDRPTAPHAKRRGLRIALIVVALLALAIFAFWRWAVSAGSAATLEWIDLRFGGENQVELAARVSYGEHPAQYFELWRPETASGPAPLVVFYHGGGWHSGAPEEYRFIARTLGRLGYATALVGYRLVPDGRYPAMLEDSAAGLRSVLAIAPANRVAADKVVLMGHSAGAYNAVMLALEPRWLAQAGVPQSRLAGVVGLAGPYDFHPFTRDSSRNAFGHATDPAATQPIRFARSGAPPLLLLSGASDTVVRPRNTRALAQAMADAGGEFTAEVFPDMSHAGIIMAFSKPFERDGAVLDTVAPIPARACGQAGFSSHSAR